MEMAEEKEWKFVVVEDVKCIQFLTIPNNEKERGRRRKTKQTLGNEYLEYPILDMKMGPNNSTEICDVLFISDRVDTWINEFSSMYSSMKLSVRSTPIAGGYQKSWHRKAETYITLILY